MNATGLFTLSATTCAAAIISGYSHRSRQWRGKLMTTLAAATICLAYGGTLLTVWPSVKNSLGAIWFSNQSSTTQLAAEILPVVIIAVLVTIPWGMRAMVLAVFATFILSLGSLLVTDPLALRAIGRSVVSDTRPPLPHGIGVHTPPGLRFVGYAGAAALAISLSAVFSARRENEVARLGA